MANSDRTHHFLADNTYFTEHSSTIKIYFAPRPVISPGKWTLILTNDGVKRAYLGLSTKTLGEHQTTHLRSEHCYTKKWHTSLYNNPDSRILVPFVGTMHTRSQLVPNGSQNFSVSMYLPTGLSCIQADKVVMCLAFSSFNKNTKKLEFALLTQEVNEQSSFISSKRIFTYRSPCMISDDWNQTWFETDDPLSFINTKEYVPEKRRSAPIKIGLDTSMLCWGPAR